MKFLAEYVSEISGQFRESQIRTKVTTLDMDCDTDEVENLGHECCMNSGSYSMTRFKFFIQSSHVQGRFPVVVPDNLNSTNKYKILLF